MDFKGKQPIGFDKSKLECYNYHRTWHFAKECKSGRNQGKRSYGDNNRSGRNQALVAQDGLGGYDWSNDFDVEPVNYALMSISSSSSSSSSEHKAVQAEIAWKHSDFLLAQLCSELVWWTLYVDNGERDMQQSLSSLAVE
ncbi:hypothetical protein Tco_0495698 [Tanacetum coccineum]